MSKLRPALQFAAERIKKGAAGAEVGVLGGTNAISIIEGMPDLARLHLVDSYGGINYRDKKFNDWTKKFDAIQDKITWHIMPSIQAANGFAVDVLSFVYIDANHRYFNCKQDICAWWPKVNIGGIIGGHDYNTGSVKDAVNDWAAENRKAVQFEGTDWWIEKNIYNRFMLPNTCLKCKVAKHCDFSPALTKLQIQQILNLLNTINNKVEKGN